MTKRIDSIEATANVGPPEKVRILIVDPINLRGELWVRAIEQSNIRGEIELVETIPPSQIGWNIATYSLVIFNTGRLPLQDNPDFQKLSQQQVNSRCVVTVVVSEREDPDDVRCAVCAGAKGLVPGSLHLPMALSAIEFILNGGCYFPTTAIGALLSPHIADGPSVRASSIEGHECPQEVAPRDDGHKIVEPAYVGELTGRQRQVLTLLAEGLPNKVIARRLGMQEGTVKVHVRFIMRKFGVANRTQVAILNKASKFSDRDVTRN